METKIDRDDIDPAVFIDDKGQAYLFRRNTKVYSTQLKDNMTNGGSFRRSVAIDRLYYIEDGSLKRVIMTTEGVEPAE